MILLKTSKPDITLNLDGSVNLIFKTSKGAIKDFDKLNTNEVMLEIKEFHPKRSLTQNSYMWALINQLADKMHDTSENIYRHFVRDYGVKDYILVKDSVIDTLILRWEKRGIGWFSEVMRKGKLEDTTTLIVYYGSSSYNSKEMARLIDAVIESCEENEIPTLTKIEFNNLRNEND